LLSPARAREALRILPKVKVRARLAAGLSPISYLWGGDRGTPLYYFFIRQFLKEFSADIRGHCLEFYEDAYASEFGGEAITRLDILHIDDSNPKATLVGDLTRPNDLPGETFDCIICTHTLHLIFDALAAVTDMYRLLKPGGVLLTAVPLVSMDDPDWHEFWRFTKEGLFRTLATVFPEDCITVRAYGNSLTSCGQLRGLTVEDFTPRELAFHDYRFALEICGRSVKPG
jgi:SAM-dependent methyltransferase